MILLVSRKKIGYNTHINHPTQPSRPDPRSQIPDPMTYAEMFTEIAQKYGLDWRLLAEQAWAESRLDPLAVGKANDMGLFQIIPSTWDEWAPRIGVVDPFDPYSNVLVAAAYLAFLRDYVGRFGLQDYYWVLLAYNWGPGNVRRLMEAKSGWLDVPASRREYAVSIILQANVQGLVQAVPEGITAPVRDLDVAGDTYDYLDDLLATTIPITPNTPLSVRRRAT